jgi:8-oxo-dGTP pyrophosphatase MutT (NUDIX family)
MPVKPPAIPSAAATLVLLRDRPAGGPELLLIKRHTKSKFAAGDHVFPGGKVGTGDNPEDAIRWCRGLDASAAAARLGVSTAEAVALHVGAIRETFEEVGLLLAYDDAGAFVRADAPRFAEYRAAGPEDNLAFWAMVRAERLTLATDRLVYFAHWITPEEQPLRFDTRFFVADLPPGQEAQADGYEITELRWLGPAEALAAFARGEISLRNPTARNIELFVGATSAADGVRRVTGREIPTIRPRILFGENGARRVLMPGDEGWF